MIRTSNSKVLSQNTVLRNRNATNSNNNKKTPKQTIQNCTFPTDLPALWTGSWAILPVMMKFSLPLDLSTQLEEKVHPLTCPLAAMYSSGEPAVWVTVSYSDTAPYFELFNNHKPNNNNLLTLETKQTITTTTKNKSNKKKSLKTVVTTPWHCKLSHSVC